MEISSASHSSSDLNQSEDNSMSSDQSAVFSSIIRGDDCDSTEEDSETYYFESDHVALKGNPEYQMLLRTITLLEAQRIQAVKDLDRLYEAQEEALSDPIQFVDKLQRGLDLKLPKQQKIASTPNICWEKYTSQLDFSTFGVHKHMTRLKRQLVDGSTDEDPQSCSTDGDGLVRGRIKTENKPETFNQLWTVEEQKRLEDLLRQYPPEEVEAKRWQKIAVALGNRTPIQVQSRVQKYFIKLAKAGLPIPGRAPNLGAYKKKSKNRYQKYHKFYYQPSTFLQSYEPPVYMSDDEDNSQSYEGSIISGMDGFEDQEFDSDEEHIPPELRSTPEYQELLFLKQLRQEKLSQTDRRTHTEHAGFKCDRCNCEPIIGTRWHCTDCPPEVAVDFCEECMDSQYETETHNSSHRLKPKHKAEDSGYMDTDYMGFMPGGACSGYNYLDPNYMPAT